MMKKSLKIIGFIILGGVILFAILFIIAMLDIKNDEINPKKDTGIFNTIEAKHIYNSISTIQNTFHNPKSIIVKEALICKNLDIDENANTKPLTFAKVDLSAQNKAGGYTSSTYYIYLEEEKISTVDIKYSIIYNYDLCRSSSTSLGQDDIKKINSALEENY